MTRWWRNLSVSKKLYSVVGLMAILIATELFTLLFAMNTLSSLRAFVMGEGLWSKSQKDAIHALYEYALYGKEKYYSEFRDRLKIPNGDHKARIELMKPHCSYEIVRQGFLEGGNHPSDIPGMIHLLVRFHRNKYIAAAIRAWTKGDVLLGSLRTEAADLRQAMQSRGRNSNQVRQVLTRIAEINRHLTQREIEFSASLGAGSRWLEHTLMLILALTVFTVESTGISLTYAFSRSLSRSLTELKDTAAGVGMGNFSLLAPVRSKDELGQLAESLNKMILALKANVEERKSAEDQLTQLNRELEKRVKARAEESLKRELQLRLITDALPELVAQVDRNKLILFANGAFRRRFDPQGSGVIGKTLQEVFGEEQFSNDVIMIQQALMGEIVVYERVSDDGGSHTVHNVTLIPERDMDREVVGFIFVAVDVSDYKAMVRELKLAKEAADEANRTKSAFLANMSHEIRTPLGAILGYSELMATVEMTPSDRLNSVEVIKRNGRLLSGIISDILDLSKVEAGKLEVEQTDIVLEEVIKEVEALLDLEASGKGIRLTIKADGPIPNVIRTDPLRLRQILINVIGNAIKFTNKGSVEVLMKLISENGNPKVAFVVKDTGIGIEQGKAKRLFEPFQQGDPSTTRKFGGSGLGLVLAKRLAKSLGGDVALANSVPGVGSTFIISIDPGRPEKIFFESHEQFGGEMPSLATPHFDPVNLVNIDVLVVDDSFDNLTLISKILRFAGANVETASTGREAVEKALAGNFSLILMDLQMPIMDGYEATQVLRSRGYRRPIVALTAHAMKSERTRCLQSGFNDHVTKPIDQHALLSTVSHYAVAT